MKILVITVGGSFEPVVTAVRSHKPDFVYFICSNDREIPTKTPGSYTTVDGDGLPCTDKKGNKHPSIVAQVNLPGECYEKVLIDNLDNLENCYNICVDTFKKIRLRFPGAIIHADYTGGTKTMSAGLVTAALDEDITNLFFVGGERSDLISVTEGSQRIVRCDRRPLDWLRRQRILETCFAKYDYTGCLNLIEEVSHDAVTGSKEDALLQAFLSLSKAFLYWDRCDYEKAIRHLTPYARYFKEHQVFLARVIRCKSVLTGAAGNTSKDFSPVHDIILNADRRMSQASYDDAVARTYRALELFAQLCLAYQIPPIYTGNVDITLLPAELQEKYLILKGTTDKLQLPLIRSYELLKDFNHPVGLTAWERRDKMVFLLQTRNNSIFAHGFTPIDRQDAANFLSFVRQLVRDGEELMKVKTGLDQAPQFPGVIPDKIWSG